MKQRKCVTGAPNAWKSPAHDFRPFVADSIDPGYNDPLSKINNMLYRSRVETWMEETGCTYSIISGLLGKTVSCFADMQALTDTQIDKLCNIVRINKDYFYHKNKSYKLLYQQPMTFTRKEDGTVEERKTEYSLEERNENMKTPEGQIKQFLSEYFDLHATGESAPCTKIIAGFKSFREKNKLTDPFSDGKIIPMILELGYRRRFVLEGKYVVPSIEGIKLKVFVKCNVYGNPSTPEKDAIPENKEMNLLWFDRVKKRIDAVGIDPIKLMKWIGRTSVSIYTITSPSWIYKGFTQNLAWMLKTTPDYLIGKTDDPFTGADKVSGHIGRSTNTDWFVLMDGTKIKNVSEEHLIRAGIPEHMIQYVLSGKRVVLKSVAERIGKFTKIPSDQLIDDDLSHYPESDPSLLTNFRKDIEETKEEKKSAMGGNLMKIKKAASAVEVAVATTEVKPLINTPVPDTKTGMKRFCDDYLTFTRSGNDMIFARPLFDLYEEYCNKYHYSRKMYSEFTGYIRSRGGREKQTPEGQDLFARVSSNSLQQLIYKGPKQNPKKAEETVAPVVEEVKVEEAKPEVKNAEAPKVVETEKKLDISFDTRHIMTLIDSASEEEIEDLEKQMDTVTASIEKLREYIKLARMIKSMKENAYS